jgi:hypothetical protein
LTRFSNPCHSLPTDSSVKVNSLRLPLYLAVLALISCAAYAQPGVDNATVNGTLSPSQSFLVFPGATTSIATVFQDNGAGVTFAFLTFEVWPSPSFTCKIGVQLGSPLNQSVVYLHDDGGNSEAGMTVGSGQSESNSKCSLFAAGSSVTQSGIFYTVTVSVVFNAPYNGIKYIYGDAYDRNGVSSGWYVPNAAFTVSSQDFAPQSISVAPSGGSSLPGDIKQFQVTIHDLNGIFTVWHLEFMLSAEGSGWQPGYTFQPTQRCKVVAEASANLIWVENDSENGLSPPGFGNFGGSNPSSISSNRCTLYPSLSSAVYPDIDTGVFTFAVSFNPAFTGLMQDHMYIADNTGLDHWDTQAEGTWTWNVQGGAPTPTIGSLSTSSALVGACTSTFILGSGLSGNPQISSTDPNITFTVNSISDSQLGVTLCINSGDTDGDTLLFVTSFAQQSAGTRLTKQIPGSISVISSRILSTVEATAIGCRSSEYGVLINIKYQVNDRAGRNIAAAGMIPVEKVTQYVVNGVLFGDPQPTFTNFTNNIPTDQAGSFLDTPFGQCGTGAFISSDIQEIAIQIGASRYSVRTNNWQYRSSSPATGSVSNGGDINLAR